MSGVTCHVWAWQRRKAKERRAQPGSANQAFVLMVFATDTQ